MTELMIAIHERIKNLNRQQRAKIGSGCLYKKRHEEIGEAVTHAVKHGGRIYVCEVCAGYHITSG